MNKIVHILSDIEFEYLKASLVDNEDILNKDLAAITIVYEDNEIYRFFKHSQDIVLNAEVYPNTIGIERSDAENIIDFINTNLGKEIYILYKDVVSISQLIVHFLIDEYGYRVADELKEIEIPDNSIISTLKYIKWDKFFEDRY